MSVETVSTDSFADSISGIQHRRFKKNLTNSRYPAHMEVDKGSGIPGEVDLVCLMHMIQIIS